MFRRHPALTAFTVVYLGVVAWVTLGPQPLDTQAQGVLYRALRVLGRHASTDWITYDRVEFGANVAMFLPIGLFLLLLLGRRQWWLAIVIGFVMTVSIEVAQLYLPGRVSDLRDVVSNTTGATLGVLLALVLTAGKARRIRRERARALALPN
ncbi:VanZ family protein [Subtercola boreus]|uniref:VanZ family protein n=1 Tax=Subtercola boreus TaxID=120213 RepID=A0A3E0WDG0_9MICO|nr:VanZ family protein [Subtercola boreus]RFA21775.1 VanZ family protein [Subtercola boreus]RFA21887.1 VanZ family protein [Subtercola boreus]RFA27834.1 VanZ family protein [Subtercola boreus]